MPAGEAVRVELLGTPPARLSQILGGSGRAQIPWRMLRHGLDPLEPGALPEGSRRRLLERCHGMPLTIDERRVAGCGATKLLLRLRDGATVESVIIPSARRTTVCVSSQVGCARACGFCLTGAMGLTRSLTAAEIVGQVVLAIREVALRGWAALRNVVFMGMGEPLDTLGSVRAAIDVITAPHGLGIGPSRITLSTVGTSPERIRAGEDLARARVRFAWSLHTADPELRRRLIPTANHDPIPLRAAFLDLLRVHDDDLFVEVALIHDLNDGPGDAEALLELLEPLHPHARVNLLPLNRGRGDLEPTTPERAEAFRTRLYQAGVRCIIRQPRGAEIGAACGQLVSAAAATGTSAGER